MQHINFKTILWANYFLTKQIFTKSEVKQEARNIGKLKSNVLPDLDTFFFIGLSAAIGLWGCKYGDNQYLVFSIFAI